MPHVQIPVACVQTRAHARDDFDRVWPTLLASVEKACVDTQLVVLPEGSVPGYVLGERPVEPDQLERAERDIARIARARRTTIVYGAAKIVQGRVFNAAIVVGPTGEQIGYAAKQFLWHFDGRWFARGETLEPIATPLGRLGVLVCADGRIPSIAATLVDRGAQLLVMPTAWVTSGRNPAALENIQADLMINVRARENGVPFVVANKCGVELQSVAYCGKSAIVDAMGDFVARANERDASIVRGRIEIDSSATRTRRGPVPLPFERTQPTRARARIAFAFADATNVENLAHLAAQADADCFVSCGPARAEAGARAGLARIAVGAVDDACDVTGVAGDIRFAVVSAQTFDDPRGLVAARLAGIDLFIVVADGDSSWNERLARTRAAELRAFVLVFDENAARSFAVDPDGVVIAGTFDDYAVAAFAYDAARAAASLVAPGTDVLAGLRGAEAIRSARPIVNV